MGLDLDNMRIDGEQKDGKSFFEEVGGYPTLKKVHKIFYDKVFKHPWLSKFFRDKSQDHLEDQQTDFMAGLFGGPKKYCGRFPREAHMHINVTEELFDLRHRILETAILEAGLSEEHAKEWLRLDGSFRRAVVKRSPDLCKKRWVQDEILDFENPVAPKKAG